MNDIARVNPSVLGQSSLLVRKVRSTFSWSTKNWCTRVFNSLTGTHCKSSFWRMRSSLSCQGSMISISNTTRQPLPGRREIFPSTSNIWLASQKTKILSSSAKTFPKGTSWTKSRWKCHSMSTLSKKKTQWKRLQMTLFRELTTTQLCRILTCQFQSSSIKKIQSLLTSRSARRIAI